MFTPEEGAAFNALADHVRLRRFGADCYAYGMLASGCVALVVVRRAILTPSIKQLQ